jgi:hypothetical protein
MAEVEKKQEFLSIKPVARESDGLLIRPFEKSTDLPPIIAMMERDLSGKALLLFCLLFFFFFFSSVRAV